MLGRPRKSPARQFNSGAFIRTTLAAEPIGHPSGSFLGIDEGLNNEEHIGAMCRRLLLAGVVSVVSPLWYQRRQTADGTMFSVPGSSLSPSPLWPDVGRPVRNVSWPDDG